MGYKLGNFKFNCVYFRYTPNLHFLTQQEVYIIIIIIIITIIGHELDLG